MKLIYLIWALSLTGSLAHSEPRDVLVQVEWIQLDKTLYMSTQSKIKSTADKLREALQKLVKEKKATIEETSLISCRPGEAALVTSALQMIYPTEYDPPGKIPPELMANNKTQQKWNLANRGGDHKTVFEEQPVGTILEVEPRVGGGADRETISLILDSEIIRFTGTNIYLKHLDKWGHNDIQFPKFAKTAHAVEVIVRNKHYQLIGTSTPTDAKGKPLVNKINLVFVRAVLRITHRANH